MNASDVELIGYCERWAATVGRFGAGYPGPLPEKFLEIARRLKGLAAELEEAKLAATVAGTDTAAYWKGHDEAVAGVARVWRQSLEDPVPKSGAMNEPLESLYRRTEALRVALAEGK